MVKTFQIWAALGLVLIAQVLWAGEAFRPARGEYEIRQLMMLNGQRTDVVQKFLGEPTSNDTEKPYYTMVWYYALANRPGSRQLRDYAIHDNDKGCRFCERLSIFFKGIDRETSIVSDVIADTSNRRPTLETPQRQPAVPRLVTNKQDCSAESINTAEKEIRLAREQGSGGVWEFVLRDGERVIATCKARAAMTAKGQTETEKFKKEVMLTKTVFGVQVFSRVDISENIMTLGLRNQYFLRAWDLFADLGDAFAKWCECEAITHVTLDLSHVGIDMPPMLKFVYDPVAKHSVMRQ